MITCKICEKIFKSTITFSHLKSHDMTTTEYKNLFGNDSMSSEEYRNKKAEQFSKGNKGKTPWNAGKKIEPSIKQNESYKSREQKYQSGELQRRTYTGLSEDTKAKISNSVKQYAIDNPEKVRDRFTKAQQTKIQLGLPLIPSALGYKHTEDNKKIFAKLFKFYRERKKSISHENILSKINSVSLELLNSIENNNLELLCTICNTQFNFTKQYFHDCKFHDKLCPTCFPRNILTSKSQLEIYEYVLQYYPKTILNYKTLYGDIDIYVPELNIGIEFNGLYWHSAEVLNYNNKSKIKDYEKYLKLKNDCIKIICIFEDEWINRSDIVKSRLNNLLKLYNKTIFARKCVVKNIETDIARKFVEENHIQGYSASNIKLGLYHNDNLVSIMTFSKNNLSRKSSGWEIDRFCSLLGHIVIGGGSKLLSHFIKQNNPDEILTYADSRWSDGNVYKNMGFEYVRNTVPNYWYFKPNELKRIHRFNLRKNSYDDPNKTEKQLRFEQGYYHIYDYGSSKWLWKSQANGSVITN